jgi:hypothetical protein
MRQYSGKRDAFIERRRRGSLVNFTASDCNGYTYDRAHGRSLANFTASKKWKLWKAGVCQAMTEDVNGAWAD